MVDELFGALVEWISPSKVDSKKVSKPKPKKKPAQTKKAVVLDGLDTEDGLRRVRGDTKLYNKILSKFTHRTKNYIEDFLKLYEGEDKEETIRSAHSMKGVAANIGAKELQTAAEKLESALKEEKPKDPALKKIIKSLETELNNVLVAIQKYQSSPINVGSLAVSRRSTRRPKVRS